MASKEYDILLCGVTGFTGRLCAEHLLENVQGVTWAACARNAKKAEAVLAEVCAKTGKPAPPVEVADLVCADADAEEKLRAVVKKARVVLTTAGPFEKYGQTLVKLCAEEGVHYADITGETDFVRKMIEQHDATARKTGASIVPHCGNDCVPWDLTVLKFHEAAAAKGSTISEVKTYTEVPPGFGVSGGTLTTAVFQLGKKRGGAKPAFDALLTNAGGAKSAYAFKNASLKGDKHVAEFGRAAGPWIMAPVMTNCVRRSNALLGYADGLTYGEQQLRDPSFVNRTKDSFFAGLVGAAVALPSVFGPLLPKPGEGPARADMEAGWLRVHGRAKLADGGAMVSTFEFGEDTGYLGTARMLVECGVLLAAGPKSSGVITPAVAFGSGLLEHLEKTTPTTFTLAEAPP
mmetsp:Transcript_13282/g.40910  ORF Transcript_13282/g.40910 Transcript_13282/m.40910 type:complete len:404 (-) Transcript_13282:202-1413(-)